jgi:predicted nucleic acid-binding Zn ribbon protein
MPDDTRHCAHCGRSVAGMRADAVYCRRECRHNARRKRQRAELRELRAIVAARTSPR